MSGTLALPVDAIVEALNRDPEFVLTARFWYADLRLGIGDDYYFMRIEDGVVTRLKHGTQGFDAYDIHVGGPVAVWQKMLEARPEPFYHDWFAACFHHDFELSGDLGAAYAYYFALRRIHAVMGECVRALAAAA